MSSSSSLTPAVAALAGLALLWAGLRWFEHINIFFPAKQLDVIPASFGMSHEEVDLTARDGVRLHGWFLPAPAHGPLAARELVLLYCHGNAGNISSRVHKANIYHQLGLNVLLFDYRGYGKSSGQPSEEGTYRDAEAAWRYLTEKKRFSPQAVIMYGESLGCAVALETALRHPPGALLLESPFTSIPDMGREIYPWLPVRWIAKTRYDNLAKIPRLKTPLLLMHSPKDAVVPERMGRTLFAAAPEPKEFFALKGSHDEGYMDSGAAYPRTVLAFLKRRLPAY